MAAVFYVSAVIAVVSGILAISRFNVVHALLYLIVSLLAVAVVMLSLGAPFAAAVEVIVNAGAIIVLFIFVVMMLNLGAEATEQERRWLQPGDWAAPACFLVVLAGLFVYAVIARASGSVSHAVIDPGEVGATLFQPYLIAVELASALLLAGLIGAYRLGSRQDEGGTK